MALGPITPEWLGAYRRWHNELRCLLLWLGAAARVRPTCQNVEVYDERIAEQRARLSRLGNFGAGFGDFLDKLPERESRTIRFHLPAPLNGLSEPQRRPRDGGTVYVGLDTGFEPAVTVSWAELARNEIVEPVQDDPAIRADLARGMARLLGGY